jgi:hypothetical protein
VSLAVVFHHTGSMPCPVCGVEAPHAHNGIELADAAAATRRATQGGVDPALFRMSAMATQVMAERQRQVDLPPNGEGFTVAHDVGHYTKGELVRAAICYALHAAFGREATPRDVPIGAPGAAVKAWWPWTWGWFKVETRRHSLVKAAALLIAEGERQDAVADAATAELEKRL